MSLWRKLLWRRNYKNTKLKPIEVIGKVSTKKSTNKSTKALIDESDNESIDESNNESIN